MLRSDRCTLVVASVIIFAPLPAGQQILTQFSASAVFRFFCCCCFSLPSDHEAEQLKMLKKLLKKEAASGAEASAQVEELAGMDRKARNKLEKRLRRALGLPKTDAQAEDASKTGSDTVSSTAAAATNPVAQTAAERHSEQLARAVVRVSAREDRREAQRAHEAVAAAERNRRKRAEVRERYRLPAELHIPQELLLAHPVANARRVEKESKLYKYKRNAPNYAELVAKVRKEFIDSLPTAMGAGSASGADGNAQTISSGWDRFTTPVAEFVDVEGSGEELLPAIGGPKNKIKKEEGDAEEAEEEEGGERPAKRSKHEKKGSAVTTVSESAASDLPLLHQSYHPRFVSSFSWLPEQNLLRKGDINPLDPASLLAYTASRMTLPGAPYPYAKPNLPLIFRPNNKGFEVDKPGIVALIMAARTAGIQFNEGGEDNNGTAAAAAAAQDAEMQDAGAEEAEKEGKKSKKNKKRKHEKEESDSAAAGSSSSSASVSSSVPRVRFVSYRNNFRKFFARRDYWRVDIQRVGNTIYLRRHLNYNYVNPFDVGSTLR